MKFQYKMNTEDLLKDDLDPAIKDLLKSVAVENEFVCYKFQKSGCSMKGSSYLGVVIGIEIIGKDKNHKDKILSVVMKSSPKSDALRAQIQYNKLFKREMHIYNVVLSTFSQLESDKGIISSLVTPKFYKATFQDKHETLILENLKNSGYKIHGHAKVMNAEHVHLVLKQYGKLHALSFALYDQFQEKFKEVIQSMDEMFVDLIRENTFISTIKHLSVKALKALNEDLDREAYIKYKNFVDKINSFFDEIRNSATEDYSVALHGDGWLNNLMFKYNNSNDFNKPTDVRFIDFQLSRPGPPVIDIAFFFYSCAEKELIERLDEFLKIYYSSLSSHLVKLGSNPKKVYPYEVLQKQWMKYARFGLVMTATVFHVMLSEENEVVDFTNVAESNRSIGDAFKYEIANIDVYYDRLRYIILHFIKNNFI